MKSKLTFLLHTPAATFATRLPKGIQILILCSEFTPFASKATYGSEAIRAISGRPERC